MLQHNNKLAQRAHLAHAGVVGLHALCCGLPALALMAAFISGTASGVALFTDYVGLFHDFLHGYEVQVLVLSAVLVVAGGALELRRSLRQRTPWLFGVSVLCFLANIGIVVLHRA